MASIHALPNEVLVAIFQRITPVRSYNERTKDRHYTSTLHRLIQVCQKWHNVGIPLLYTNVTLNDISQATRFVETIFHFKPAYAALMYRLDMQAVDLPEVLSTRLIQCTFVNLTSLSVRTAFAEVPQASGMVAAHQLKHLEFRGEGCQEFIDRHSASLGVLKLGIGKPESHLGYYQTYDREKQPKAMLALSLPRLWRLDLSYYGGSKGAMPALAQHLPALTHLYLEVQCTLSSAGLEEQVKDMLNRMTGLQTLSIKAEKEFGGTWPLNYCRLNRHGQLENFVYSGPQLPSTVILLQSLPPSLKSIRIHCERLLDTEVQQILDLLVKQDRFPNLIALPDVTFVEFSPQAFLPSELKAKRDGVYMTLAARGLEYNVAPRGLEYNAARGLDYSGRSYAYKSLWNTNFQATQGLLRLWQDHDNQDTEDNDDAGNDDQDMGANVAEAEQEYSDEVSAVVQDLTAIAAALAS